MNVYSSRKTSSGYEHTGQLIQPSGFESLLSVLTYVPLDEFSAAGQLNHLINLTVIETERIDLSSFRTDSWVQVSMFSGPAPTIINHETILMK
jgi:hypothetical protein